MATWLTGAPWPDPCIRYGKKSMKTIYIAMAWIIAAISCTTFSCTTPGPVTARPDPNTSTSGTLGSVKATNGVLPLTGSGIPRDTARMRKDTIH
jgi:hypothetical protein